MLPDMKPLTPEPSKRVAFVGKMHSGKTTASNIMQTDYRYERVAFADPVKDVASVMLNAFVSWMENRGSWSPNAERFDRYQINEVKGNPTFRKFLQWVGTDLGRNWWGPDDIWIQFFEGYVNEIAYGADYVRPVVNDDTRFPNEAEALKGMGFVVIKLVRDEDERLESIRQSLLKQHPYWDKESLDAAMREMANHPSETEVDNIVPHMVYENESIASLHYLAKQLAGGK